MELTPAQIDFLRIVAEVAMPDGLAGTKAVSERLRALWEERGYTASLDMAGPWHGTSEYYEELRSCGLLDHDPGIAVPIPTFGGPASIPEEYWIKFTDAGRQAVAELRPS